MEKVKTLRSCQEYLDYGLSRSDYFEIDPDGPLMGYPPFTVYCNFDTGVTEVLHDHDKITVEIAPCPDPKCFELNITYNVDMEQITALKEISEKCTQHISY